MRSLSAFVALAFILMLTTARAHDSRPLFVEIDAMSDGRIALRSAAPGAVDPGNAPVVELAPPCRDLAQSARELRRRQALYDCPSGETRLTIAWPVYNPSLSALVRVRYATGEVQTTILDPATREWTLPAPQSLTGVARSYFRIGVDHIIGGVDHLLFLAGLLLIARTPRRVFATVTGFTLAHSLTLVLVALGVVRISVPAIEAVIALSIVFLATEIVRNDRTTLAWRRPLVVASAFGLAHGAGFAAALSEIGLPKTETVAALLFFNLGVEAGQVGVIAAVFVIALAARGAGLTHVPDPARLQGIAGYALGIVSTYWFLERCAALLAV